MAAIPHSDWRYRSLSVPSVSIHLPATRLVRTLESNRVPMGAYPLEYAHRISRALDTPCDATAIRAFGGGKSYYHIDHILGVSRMLHLDGRTRDGFEHGCLPCSVLQHAGHRIALAVTRVSSFGVIRDSIDSCYRSPLDAMSDEDMVRAAEIRASKWMWRTFTRSLYAQPVSESSLYPVTDTHVNGVELPIWSPARVPHTCAREPGARERAELVALRERLDSVRVAPIVRGDQGGARPFVHVDDNMVVANRMFGPGGWSFRLTNVECTVHSDEPGRDGVWLRVVLSCVFTIHVLNSVVTRERAAWFRMADPDGIRGVLGLLFTDVLCGYRCFGTPPPSPRGSDPSYDDGVDPGSESAVTRVSHIGAYSARTAIGSPDPPNGDSSRDTGVAIDLLDFSLFDDSPPNGSDSGVTSPVTAADSVTETTHE